MPKRELLPNRATTKQGWVYLLHFDPPYKHAQHYIGFSTQPDQRHEDHLRGNGARLVAVAMAAGCVISLAMIRAGTQRDEIQLKNRGSAKKWCPVCRGKLS